MFYSFWKMRPNLERLRCGLSFPYQQKQLHRIRYNSYTPMNMWQSWDLATRCKAHHVAVIKNRPSYVLSHLSSALW